MRTVNELVKLIPRYAQSYYEGVPEIDDMEFDTLVEELRIQDPKNLLLETTGWGMKVNKQKNKVLHKYQFATGIKDKIRPLEFLKFMKNRGIDITKCIVSTKLDGASVLCYYVDGKLDICITRGDGVEGLDVTDRISLLIPNTLKDNTFTGVVRGEFILPNAHWEKYKALSKSSRNFSAGKLNADEIDASINDHRLVTYYVHPEKNEWEVHEQFRFLEENGFTVTPYYQFSSPLLEEFTPTFASEFLQELNNNVYQCDGLVVAFGNGERFAIKWNTQRIETFIKDIKWQNSRLGKLKPVIIINPVDISGATIQRVTGNNYHWILTKRLGIGSRITITRSGEVIPKIEEILTQTEYKFPERCPHCGTILRVDGVDLECPSKGCSGRGENSLLHFITTTIPINGLGEQIIIKFLQFFDIHSIIDLINLSKTNYSFELLSMCKKTAGFGESTFVKVNSMLEKLNTPIKLEKIIVGLGLPALGEKTISNIFEIYTWNQLLEELDNERLVPFSGVNYLAIQSLYEYKPYILEVINSLRNFPILPLNRTERNAIIKSRGSIGVCITGALSVSRREFVEECKDFAINEVSIAKADILVTNTPDSNSTKNKEARKRGTRILSEEEFRKEFLNV